MMKGCPNVQNDWIKKKFKKKLKIKKLKKIAIKNFPPPVWKRISGRLAWVKSISVSNLIMEMNNQTQTLKDLYYPVGSIQPSCIRLPQPIANNFEIKPQTINMLSKFTRIEDAYISLGNLKRFVQPWDCNNYWRMKSNWD